MFSNKIKEVYGFLEENQYVSIAMMEQRFGVSTSTARRYLKKCAEEGFAECIHGGAVFKTQQSSFEFTHGIKSKHNVEEKKRIADYAATLVKPGDSIFLDSGTTVLPMVDTVKSLEAVKTITNDVLVAYKLNDSLNNEVMITGGQLRRGYNTLMGTFAEMMISAIHLDKCFLGVDAIGKSGELMITSAQEVSVKRIVKQQSKETYVLCDHSKFNKTSFMDIFNARQATAIITGRELGTKAYKIYSDMGINIVMV